MPSLQASPSPRQLYEAYCAGLPGAPLNPAHAESLLAEGLVQTFGEACPHLAGIGAGKRALLYRSREKFDPGVTGHEAQTTGDCTSHGCRGAIDTTRAVEIDIQGQREEFHKRTATEPIYGFRRHGGAGMNAGHATRAVAEVGFLLREDYTDRGGPNLTKYNAEIGIGWGRGGVPAKVQELIRALGYKVGRWIQPKTVEEARDLCVAGYGAHSGQMWATSQKDPRGGINRRSGTWNHDMATSGCDFTREVFAEDVFFVPQTWGKWNEGNSHWERHRDVLGPYPTGMIVVSAEDYEREFIRSGECYYFADIAGVPAKKLPDYGGAAWYPV